MIKHVYRGHNGIYGICSVSTYRCAGKLVVMLSESATDRGPGITNNFEHIATDIALSLLEFNAISDPRTVRWIEHHGPRLYTSHEQLPPDWDEVLMDWDGDRYKAPQWRPFNGDRHCPPVLGDPCHEELIATFLQPY